MHVHPLTGRIRLALGAAVPVLDGKTILLAPARGDNDRWHWLCIPVDIPARYLPKECRGAMPRLKGPPRGPILASAATVR